MEELRQLYRRALLDQIRELEAAREPAAAGDPAALAAIRRAVHSLHGSGGTYGYPEITAAAEGVERGELTGDPLTRLIAVLRDVAKAPAPATARPRPRITVLLVDDDSAIRYLVNHVLTARGHYVLQAANGAAAVAAMAGDVVDILLMDVQLGAEDGVELAARLLSEGRNSPHLVFLTGTSHTEAMLRMESLQPASIVHKPFDPLQLAALLDQLVR